MREILFRGKRVDNGEWVYGGYYHGIMPETNNPFSIDNARIKTIIISEGTYYHVDPETVGQYTGEKNGENDKIFEGDRLDIDIDDIVVVKYEDDGFLVFGGWLSGDSLSPYAERAKIIGNIHETPEIVGE